MKMKTKFVNNYGCKNLHYHHHHPHHLDHHHPHNDDDQTGVMTAWLAQQWSRPSSISTPPSPTLTPSQAGFFLQKNITFYNIFILFIIFKFFNSSLSHFGLVASMFFF